MFFTGAKIAWTSANRSASSGSAAHRAQLRMFSGFALPATAAAISGWASENWRASSAISTPRAAQQAAARRAASYTGSGSFNQAGSGAKVSSRALNGPAFITPTPRAFKYGTVSSANRVFCSVYWL